MPIAFDRNDLEATRAANRFLARMPRLRLHNPVHRNLVQGLIRLAGRFAPDVTAIRGVRAEERTVAALGRTVRVRILRPPGSVRGIHLYIHGGGWTIGSAKLDDALTADVAVTAGAVVVSVEYRLAPAHPFAACLDDCETAARWALERGLAEFGVERMTVGGESAGGHLAAATVLRLRDAGYRFDRVAGAVLTYGCFDLGAGEMAKHAGPDTLVLHGPTLGRVVEKVTGLADREARRAPGLSPLYADLVGLPPALMIVGTRDPLQDDSERMAAKWGEKSGNAELVIVPEAAHGFNHQANSTAAKTNAYIGQWIAARLAAPSKVSGA